MRDVATVHFPSPTGYYKVLGVDGTPCHGGSGRWRVGRPRFVRGELVPCRNGIHVVSLEQLIYWIGPAIHPVVAVSDEILHEDSKCVARRATIGPPYPTWNERTARLFACDCAERVLPLYEEKHPSDDRPRLAIEVARRFANGDATREELRDAARAAHDAYAAAIRTAHDAAAAATVAYDASAAAAYVAYDAYAAAAYVAARAAADEQRWQAERLGAYLKGEIP